tara:strand:+ start:5157 stop:6011 length:855 start_codon:yes stop_codon:yes gene_type:complete
MKIAIIGKKERAAAWEKHLRKLSVVSEVVITGTLTEDKDIAAVLLIDDSADCLIHLLRSIKLGNHTYLISKMPSDLDLLETIYHASEEAGVNVQFSHWPSMAESMNWIRQQVPKPDLIQIKKESVPQNFREKESEDFKSDWIDELALIIKWQGGNIHRFEVKPIRLRQHLLGLNLTLRYENSAVASIQYLGSAAKETHQRIFSNRNTIADCDIINQKVRLHTLNELNKVTVREKKFDASDTAEWSVVQFIKSIQMSQPTLFSPYDALQTAKAYHRIVGLMDSDK